MLIKYCIPVEICRDVEFPDSASWDDIFNEGERQKMRIAIQLSGCGEGDYEVCAPEWETVEPDEYEDY
jgi:hypothetical protein